LVRSIGAAMLMVCNHLAEGHIPRFTRDDSRV
jgi:hypothetical protein